MDKKKIISFFIFIYLLIYSTTLLVFIILIQNSLHELNSKYECAISSICSIPFLENRQLCNNKCH